MGDVKLTAPRIKVLRDKHGPIIVQADNRDLLAFERTRLKQRPIWPKMEDSPFQWLTFISWSAAKRQGLIDIPYQEWESEVIDCAALDPDDERADELGGPTVPGPEPG